MMNLNKFIQKYWPFLVFIFIIIFVCRKFLFSNGLLLFAEFIGSNDFSFFLNKYLSAWDNYTTLGHSNIGFPTTYGNNPTFYIGAPVKVLRGLLLRTIFNFLFLFLNGQIYIMVGLILTFAGAFFFSSYWFQKLKAGSAVTQSMSFIAALIYTFNSQVGSRIMAGHVNYVYGYGLFLLLLTFLFKSIETVSRQKKIFNIFVSGFIISVLFWIMPHMLFILPIIIVFYSVTILLTDPKKIFSLFLIISVASVIGILLNLDSWLPGFLYKETYPVIEDTFYSISFLMQTTSGAEFKNIITQHNPIEINWVGENYYNKLLILRSILPYLALLGIFLFTVFIKDRKKVLFLILVSLFGISYSLGIRSPLKELNIFLYKNIFLFKPFRDPSKFFMIYILGVSLSVGYLLYFINKVSKKFFLLILFAFPVYLIVSQPIFYLGNFGNSIIPFKLPEKYNELKNYFSKKTGNYRVAFFPNDQRIDEADWYPKEIRNGSIFYNVYTSVLGFPKNLAISNRTVTDFSSRYLDFLENNLDQTWAIDRLKNEGVKYLIFDKSYKDKTSMEKKFDSNTRLTRDDSIDGFKIYEIKNFNTSLTKKIQAAYYFGNINGIKYIKSNISLIDLGWNPINILGENHTDSLIFYNSAKEDAFLTSLKNYRISFFPEVRFTPDDFYIPSEYLRPLTSKGIQFYNPEIISTDRISSISKNLNFMPDNYRVFVSLLNAGNDSTKKISVSLNDQKLVKTIPSLKNNHEWKVIWLDMGTISIKNSKNIIKFNNLQNKSLLLDSLLMIPSSVYQSNLEEFYGLLKNKKIIYLKEGENLKDIEINSPNLYTTSESYSPYWNVCNSKPFMVNFYALGFKCKDGSNLRLKFTPEIVYKLSIIVAAILNLFILAIIVFLGRPRKTK